MVEGNPLAGEIRKSVLGSELFFEEATQLSQWG